MNSRQSPRTGVTTPAPVEYSVDELARAADTTVRNIRAYQDRGLLPPPERRGRAGVYTEAHLARLRLIGQLLKRGYTLGNIAELIGAWEQGQDLRELLGLEQALTSPWSEELPAYFTLPELIRMFALKVPAGEIPEAIQKAVRLEILQLEGMRFRAPRPQLIHAGAQLVALGIPLTELLDIVRMLRGNVERVADELVQLVVRHVFDAYMKGRLPPASEVPRLAETVWRLRPLADTAVNAEVARAMEGAVNKYLGEVMTHIMEQLPKPDG